MNTGPTLLLDHAGRSEKVHRTHSRMVPVKGKNPAPLLLALSDRCLWVSLFRGLPVLQGSLRDGQVVAEVVRAKCRM